MDYIDDIYQEPTETVFDEITFGYWITKDGYKIKIESMETIHIINTINFLKEQEFAEGKIVELELELRLRALENK